MVIFHSLATFSFTNSGVFRSIFEQDFVIFAYGHDNYALTLAAMMNGPFIR